jgi:aerotaxis receptor
MRTNQPVTQREYQFPATATLLSTTDTASHITYANAAFIRTSGFSADALIGQPHNIVRHPDMPQEAFADMWRSLKQGQSWTALVKNRRSDGDHYWVRANAAPMRRDGQLTGYLSARTKPTRAEIEATEPIYARFKAGRASGLAFRNGLIVRTGALKWMSALQLLPSAWRVRLPLIGVALLASPGLTAAGLTGLTLAATLGGLIGMLGLADWFIEAQPRHWHACWPPRKVLPVVKPGPASALTGLTIWG